MRVAVAGLPAATRRVREQTALAVAAGQLDATAGHLVEAVWCVEAADAPSRLLLLVHHVAVDGVSWRILLPDLATAWAAAQQGTAPAWPRRGTSFAQWAQWLGQEAVRPGRAAEVAYWAGRLDGVPPLVAGPLDPARDTIGTAGHLERTLPPAVSAALLTTVPLAFHGGIQEMLLAALTVALARERGRQGAAETTPVVVDVEGHGRVEHLAGLDVTQTVGWFTTVYPVRLALEGVSAAEAGAGGPALGRAVKAVKEQLRQVPDDGLGYGLLRYLNPATAAVLAPLPPASLAFNYLGRITLGTEGATDGLMGGVDRALPLVHAVTINAMTVDGPAGPVLQARWHWAPTLIAATTIQQLADDWFAALTHLVAYAAEPGAGGRTPSDLPLVDLTQAEIDELELEIE
jgi:non-ribosomal peptide synthase protein (TIGR01720 family)